jgi:hypothetical protein
MIPAQYARLEPFRSFVQALQEVAGTIEMPPTRAVPPFIARALPES